MNIRRILLPAGALALMAAPAIAAPGLRVAADADRNGVVDARDLTARGAGPATFLPNLDDDSGRCARAAAAAYRNEAAVVRPTARTIAAERCNDASDARVNGARDLADMARVRVFPDRHATRDARVTLRLTGGGASNARLFVRRGGTWMPARGVSLTGSDLRRGIEAAVEGKGLVTSGARRDVRVRVTVADRGRVRRAAAPLRLARFALQHDLLPAQRVLALAVSADDRATARSVPSSLGERLFEPALDGISTRTGSIDPSLLTRATALGARGQVDFEDGVRGALAGTGIAPVAFRMGMADQWLQDQFEPGYVEMPARGGVQRMRVLLRATTSGNIPRATKADLYRNLGNADLGVADVVVRDRGTPFDPSLDNGGNLESLPPSPGFPTGAALLGSAPRRQPGRALVATLRAQTDQPVILLDTSWLAVGHVDETIHVFRADTPRGFAVGVADPRLGVALMRRAQAAGHGGLRFGDPSYEARGRTIDEMLADPAWLAQNEAAAVSIDGQIAQLVASGQVTRADLVPLPVLMAISAPRKGSGTDKGLAPAGPPRAAAIVPDAVNGLSLTPRLYVAPRQHTVQIDGRDLFESEITSRLAALGVEVRFAEDRLYAHVNGGDVHCVTNALRALPPAR